MRIVYGFSLSFCVRKCVICIFCLLFTHAFAQEGTARVKIRKGSLYSAQIWLPGQAEPLFARQAGRETGQWVVFGEQGGDIRFLSEDSCGYARLGQYSLTICKQMIIRQSDTFFVRREPAGAFQLSRTIRDPLDAERGLTLPLLSFVQDPAHPLRIFIRPEPGPVDYPDAVRICAALMVIRQFPFEL
ncbi:MAG: hypothetical protein EAZ89_00975 [Bacteroidetes bacterium]|nr:MAG: hypothetical protein EAZ89_00975 [Bacteroidota bacterium]